MIPSPSQLAEQNLKANLLALPDGFELAPDLPPSQVLYARDGALTCKINGAWMSGCSVPAAAARELLGKMKLDYPTALFLSPSHPSQIRCAIQRLAPRQAIIAAIADRPTLALFLLCENFSQDLRSGKLFFCTQDQLAETLASHPGLPVPQEFIKTKLLNPELADSLIQRHTRLINAENTRRSAEIQRLHDQLAPEPAGKLLIFAPMNFYPADYASRFLADHASSAQILNADRPDHTSPLGLLLSLQGCRGMLTLRLSRPELPFMPSNFPIITWALKPPLPPPGQPCDILLVPTPDLQKQAVDLGWPDVRLAAPPVQHPEKAGEKLLLFGDPRFIPAKDREFVHSSHRLLYEAIAEELTAHPFAIQKGIPEFLSQRARKIDVNPRDLDPRVFIEELIFPAHVQGLLRMFEKLKIPVENPTPDNWVNFDSLIQSAKVVINACPDDPRMLFEYSGRPTINTLGLSADQLLENLQNPPMAPPLNAPPPDFASL